MNVPRWQSSSLMIAGQALSDEQDCMSISSQQPAGWCKRCTNTSSVSHCSTTRYTVVLDAMLGCFSNMNVASSHPRHASGDMPSAQDCRLVAQSRDMLCFRSGAVWSGSLVGCAHRTTCLLLTSLGAPLAAAIFTCC